MADKAIVTKYTMGEKPYNPKAAHNVITWNKIVPLLNKKGGVTADELREALGQPVLGDEGQELRAQHNDFLGYMLRGGHITVA